MSSSQSALQTYSFDVFDTCVTRYCANPIDLFEFLFARLLTQSGHGSGAQLSSVQLSSVAKALARQRVWAEREAHKQLKSKKSGREEILLSEVYQVLSPYLAPYLLSVAQATAAEIELELAAVSPILRTRSHIQQLRRQGHRIVYISDMYLPGAVVSQMLEANGFLAATDTVYVSSEVGVTKGSGNLFRYVCEQLAISPSDLHHTGDNFYSDVRAAKKAGVGWTYFNQGAPNRYEQTKYAPLLGDSWVRSHLIGLSRALRLRYDEGTANSRRHTTLVANIIAPLLTGYVAWVLETARQMGIKQLQCVDTLGERLGAIAQILTPQDTTATIAIVSATSISQLSTEQLSPFDAEGSGFSAAATEWMPGTILGMMPATKAASSSSISCFNLLMPKHPSASDHTSLLHYAYLETSLAAQTASGKPSGRFLEGVDSLLYYRDVLATVLSSLADKSADNCWDMIADYAKSFAQASQTTLNAQDSLGLLRHHTACNLVAFLATPTADDGLALSELQMTKQLASETEPLAEPMAHDTLAKPVRFYQTLTFGKRLVNHLPPSQHLAGSWLEASIVLSSWPMQKVLNLLHRPIQYIYRNEVAKRPFWLYKLIVLRQL
ncbi:MAG: HAD-IA family hydrolase [Cyanobacteria bacterium P01_D01_bin.36]